ncbi:hypothetical protein BGZ57DRAFT_874959 [Hyaloscypha finlandica]|nr:hypothetical protein BGZ57DRAFT_874959 [Hyaloscypha finlandica]
MSSQHIHFEIPRHNNGHRPNYHRGRYAVPQDLTPFKDKILELASQAASKAEQTKEIQKYLLRDERIRCTAVDINSHLAEWGITRGRRNGGRRPRLPSRARLSCVIKLERFQGPILQWNREGLDASEIRDRFRERFKKDVREGNIKKNLARWLPCPDGEVILRGPWRAMESLPGDNQLPELPFLPTNVLTEDELQSLKNAIQDVYLQESASQPDPTHDWPERLANALCLDETIQGIVVKEKMSPGCHWDWNRLLDPLWILGIYLPGSYQYETVNTESKIRAVVNSFTPAILRITYSRLLEWLDQAIADVLETHEDGWLDAALLLRPATTPASCIIKLLDAAYGEINVLRLDVGLRKSLRRLPLNNLPGCEDLLRCLEEESDEPSILDSFTADVTKRLERLEQARIVLADLPPLTEADMAAVTTERETNAKYQKTSRQKDQEDQGDQEDQAEPGYDNGQSAGVGRLYTILCRYARKRVKPQPLAFCKWNCPTSGPLIGHPPARFDEADWDLVDGLGRDETGENVAEEMYLDQEPQRGPVNETRNYKKCIQYLELVLTTQQPEEKEDYATIVSRMAACNSRNFQKHHTTAAPWSTNLRDDDWWHFRRLLQMLSKRYALEDEVCAAFERRMMMVLAAMEGGFTEAVLWLIPLEGLSKHFSWYISMRNKTTGSLTEPELALQQELLRELLTFSHGLALQNLTLRFHAKDPRANESSPLPKNMLLVWYTMIYQAKQTCHLRSCHRPLPHPRQITETTMRGAMLSVGLNDTRSGSSRSRSFISNDRGIGGIFPCLYTWFRGRDPHPALLRAYLWFGGIFHSRGGCKARRGKWRENY